MLTTDQLREGAVFQRLWLPCLNFARGAAHDGIDLLLVALPLLRTRFSSPTSARTNGLSQLRVGDRRRARVAPHRQQLGKGRQFHVDGQRPAPRRKATPPTVVKEPFVHHRRRPLLQPERWVHARSQPEPVAQPRLRKRRLVGQRRLSVSPKPRVDLGGEREHVVV